MNDEEINLYIESNNIKKHPFFYFEPILKKWFFGEENEEKKLEEFEKNNYSKIFSTDKQYHIKVFYFDKNYYLYYFKTKKFEEKILNFKSNNRMFSKRIKLLQFEKNKVYKIEKLLSKPKFLEDKSNYKKLVWAYNSKSIKGEEIL